MILCVCLFAFGCGKVNMSPDYEQVVRMSSITVAELNTRCQLGDPNACRLGLDQATDTLLLLVEALDGVSR